MRTLSMLDLPHSPQALVIVMSRSRLGSGGATPGPSATSSTL